MKSLPQSVIDKAESYSGDGRILQSALGAYCFGQLYGWRVLYLCNSPETLRKYESILGSRFDRLCPERTSWSRKSVGLRIVDAGLGFWTLLKGSKHKAERPLLTTEDSLL